MKCGVELAQSGGTRGAMIRQPPRIAGTFVEAVDGVHIEGKWQGL